MAKAPLPQGILDALRKVNGTYELVNGQVKFNVPDDKEEDFSKVLKIAGMIGADDDLYNH